MKKFLIKELGPTGLLLAAIVLSPLLLIGLIYSTCKSIIVNRGYKLKGMSLGLIYFIGNLLYQIWEVIKYLQTALAIVIDLLGNVTAGELIQDVVTTFKQTYFKKGSCTISMALGDIQERAKDHPERLEDTGQSLINFLDTFEKDHCEKALKLWKFRRSLKES